MKPWYGSLLPWVRKARIPGRLRRLSTVPWASVTMKTATRAVISVELATRRHRVGCVVPLERRHPRQAVERVLTAGNDVAEIKHHYQPSPGRLGAAQGRGELPDQGAEREQRDHEEPEGEGLACDAGNAHRLIPCRGEHGGQAGGHHRHQRGHPEARQP